MRILLAEDERDLNRILTAKLTEEGYSVDPCFDGLQALDYRCRRHQYRLIRFSCFHPSGNLRFLLHQSLFLLPGMSGLIWTSFCFSPHRLSWLP